MPERSRDSMDLLRLVRESALDPDYARVSARPRSRSRRAGMGIVVATTLLGLLLGGMTHSLMADRPRVAAERGSLQGQVHAAERRADALRDDVAALKQEIDELQSSGLGTGASAEAIRRELASAEAAAGAAPVRGPGLVVVVDDAVDGVPSRQEQGRVLETDLRRALNALWESGAEAVAVNGHRITVRTSVRAAGNAITVGYRSLSRPYRIEAIGDPDRLPAAFGTSSGLAWLTGLKTTYGVRVEVSTSSRLDLPGATDLDARHARKG